MLTVKRPQPETLVLPAPLDTSYQELAQKAGVTIFERHTKALPLGRLLQKEEIAIYPLQAVEAYLRSLAKKASRPFRRMEARWIWVPGYLPRFTWPQEIYTEPIPAFAIKLIVRINEAGSDLNRWDGIKYSVGTIARVERPPAAFDPFLAVHLANEKYVIAVWDEPGFGI